MFTIPPTDGSGFMFIDGAGNRAVTGWNADDSRSSTSTPSDTHTNPRLARAVPPVQRLRVLARRRHHLLRRRVPKHRTSPSTRDTRSPGRTSPTYSVASTPPTPAADERLGADASADEIVAVIDRLNADPAVDAYLLQYPFPPGLDYGDLLLRVDVLKDVDGLHPVNLGRLVMGESGPLPTPVGIVELLAAYDVPIEGRHVVIIGRGLTIGRPLANLLALKRPGLNAAVTVVHTGVERSRLAQLHPPGRHPGGGGRLARSGHA